MMRAAVHLPDGGRGPGRHTVVDLDVLELRAAELVLPEATIRDERGGDLFGDGSLVFDHAQGGGPLVSPEMDRQARAFGVVNAAYHTQRALRFVAAVLGRPLPHLVVRIGMHDQPRRWGGGHYRLPGQGAQSDPEAVSPTGEVHLGGGAGFVSTHHTQRYFHAPAHNPAIVSHEVGHHLCRHTADFRLNRLRPPQQQTNKKTALDEGTADVLTAVLLGTPDIYGWHRQAVPDGEQRRRKLDRRWTMAHFQGGRDRDPHTDGTVWASACWTARQRVTEAGFDPGRFDSLLLRGLELAGRDGGKGLAEEALRERRHFSRLVAAMVQVDQHLGPVVLGAMAEHGIHLGISNSDLSRAARAGQDRLVDA
ncbi:hypothetical protein ACQPWY_22750 [Pseudonocardia xinjiangensis]|uniref:hypothetical protein n=1 Tax=Pseudonocardia xinjiangensis TaxID=75289 RepID=UPI003D8D81C3